MYKPIKAKPTSIKKNTSYQGERLEIKINRIINNKEPIKDGAPIIYTERKDGVRPEYDIRHDKWETAVDAMTKVSENRVMGRELRQGEKTYDTMTPEQQKAFNTKFPQNKFNKNSGAEPIQTTS